MVAKVNMFENANKPKQPNKILSAGKPVTEVVEADIETKEEKDKMVVETKDEVAATVDQTIKVNEDKNETTNIIPIEKEKKKKSNESKSDNQGIIFIDVNETEIEKKYASFYLRTSTLEKIEKYAGKKKDGKTGMNKSELVDFLLEKAFDMMKVK